MLKVSRIIVMGERSERKKKFILTLNRAIRKKLDTRLYIKYCINIDGIDDEHYHSINDLFKQEINKTLDLRSSISNDNFKGYDYYVLIEDESNLLLAIGNYLLLKDKSIETIKGDISIDMLKKYKPYIIYYRDNLSEVTHMYDDMYFSFKDDLNMYVYTPTKTDINELLSCIGID